jgi:hypothetical protein
VEVPEDTLRGLAEASLAQAQLARLNDRVVELRRRMTDPTTPSTYLAGMEEKRAALLTQHVSSGGRVDIVQQRLDRVVVGIGDLLFPWSVLKLPEMTEGIDLPPATPDTTGDITTLELYSGGVVYAPQPYGRLSQNSSPAHERFWVHNWSNSAVFPPAPGAGRLYYRFTVGAGIDGVEAMVEAGSIRAWVTIGTVSNILTWPPTTFHSVGFPIVVILPTSNQAGYEIGGSVSAIGSIPVNAGDSAAIAFIYGVAMSVESGYLDADFGGFGTHRGVADHEPANADDYQKMDYRFEPDWFIEAVSGRLQDAPSTD